MMTRAFFVAALSFALPVLAGSPPTRGNAAGQNEASPLGQVRKVFIEKMDNDFDHDLQIQITRQFKGGLNVVLDREMADAILVGISKADRGGIGRGTLKYMGLDNSGISTLTLLDKSGKTILWAEEAGDRAPWASGYVNDSGRRAIAQRLVRKLKSAMWTR